MLLKLALKSLWNRRVTSLLTLLAISLGVALFIGIERVRLGVREGFSNSISQTDLIVGARGSNLSLLLYSVFHLGRATNNISYKSYEELSKHPAVSWTILYSLGDSHRSYRVVATTGAFFEQYRFRGEKRVEFLEGRSFEARDHVVVGSLVAKRLGYKLGDQIVLAHGIVEGDSIYEHEDKPFKIVGVLKPTGTPIDRALYISLEAMEFIHANWKDGVPAESPASEFLSTDLKPTQITSFLLRTKSRIDALQLQREISEYKAEPLMAIIPGVAMSELWASLSYAETALQFVSMMVLAAGILGLFSMLLSAAGERRREMTILRVLGAGPFKIFSLLLLEVCFLALVSIVFGLVFVFGFLSLSQDWILREFHLFIPIVGLREFDFVYLGLVLLSSIGVALIPALVVYRRSLSDGLSVRL